MANRQDKHGSYLQPGIWDTLVIVIYDTARLLDQHPEFIRDFNALPGVSAVGV